MIGAVFFVALVVTTVLVGIDKALESQMIRCQHCGRDRFRKSYCGHCGIVGNPAPEPPKKNSRRSHVRFH